MGGVRTGYGGYDGGMGNRVHTIPRTKPGELQNHLRNTADTPHWNLPYPDHPGPHSRPRGGIKSLPGDTPQNIGGPKNGCGTDGEPPIPTGVKLLGVFWAGRPIMSLQEMAAVPEYVEVFSGWTR